MTITKHNTFKLTLCSPQLDFICQFTFCLYVNSKIYASFQICELHFNADDIEKITSAYDPKTGKLLTAPLDRPRLKKDTVPSKLPGCPTYLSSKQAPAREDPESRHEHLENQALDKVIEQSVKSHTKMVEKISFARLEEFKSKLSDCEKHSDWVTVTKANNLCLVLLKDVP
ncbi:uncharacterized protein LOC126162407 [Schistocerca cancellata]|uniref:uncharacterized protein LOC126162407 n=1 Tax=Schistocerca cancellata TaxID=274614 RepID=UPI0021172C8B|nr:uncharacterized protein LOC126162407 [Schistocerca cancellata]